LGTLFVRDAQKKVALLFLPSLSFEGDTPGCWEHPNLVRLSCGFVSFLLSVGRNTWGEGCSGEPRAIPDCEPSNTWEGSTIGDNLLKAVKGQSAADPGNESTTTHWAVQRTLRCGFSPSLSLSYVHSLFSESEWVGERASKRESLRYVLLPLARVLTEQPAQCLWQVNASKSRRLQNMRARADW
jgi:hypothetical protein